MIICVRLPEDRPRALALAFLFIYGQRTIAVLSLRTRILILLYHFASEVILVLVKACIRYHVAALLPSKSRLP